MRETHLDPTTLGIPRASATDLNGGDATESAEIARAVLGGAPGPRRDVVVLNAAAALEVSGAASTLEAGMTLAAAALDDGRAAVTLDRWVEASRTG